MKQLPKLNGNWDTIFSGVQAVCMVVGTILALYGIFFTSLPETIIKQLRVDIAATNEELIDLRRQRREIEQQLDMSQKRLGGAQVELDAKGKALSDLESKRTALSAQVQSIAREREKYFSNTYATVVSDLIRTRRFHLSSLREGALQAREYPQVRSWLAEGRGLFSEHDQPGTAEAHHKLIKARYSWLEREPTIWSRSHLLENLNRGTPGIDFLVYERQAQEFERAVSKAGEQPMTGHWMVQRSLTEAGLQRLTDTDQEELRLRVLSAFPRESDDMAGPLRVVLPPGWTEDDIVLRAIAVIARLDRLEILINALEHDLKTRAKQ